MLKLNKIILFFSALSLILGISLSAVAQENQLNEELNIDENIQAQDLGVKDPKILPGDFFYFLKSFSRGVQSFFTFGTLKNAELQMKFASERILEARKLAEEGKTDLAQKTLEKQLENLQKAEKIIEKKKGDPKTETVLEKLAAKTVKHQKVMDGIGRITPIEGLPAINEIKEKVIENYISAEDPVKIEERLKKVVKEESGSDFKEMKNLQVLQRIKDLVPEEAKPAIEKVIENQINTFKENFSALPAEKQEKIENYISEIGGNKVQALEVLSRIKKEELRKESREKLEIANEKLIEKISEELEAAKEAGLPEVSQEIFDKLKSGEFEKIEVLEELENLSVEFLPQVLEIERIAKEKFLENLENLPPGKQKELIDKIVNKATFGTLQILSEEKELFSPEKKEKIEALETKIKEKIKQDLSIPPTVTFKEKVDKFIEGKPEEDEIIDALPLSSEVKKELRTRLMEKIQNKMAEIENPEKLEQLKNKIKEKTIQITPGVSQTIREKTEIIEEKINSEEIKSRIEKAKNLLEELKKKIEEKKEKVLEPEYKELTTLKQLIERQIEAAQKSLEDGKLGEAWGQITAALSKIRNALNILDKLEWKEVFDCPVFVLPLCLQGEGIEVIKLPNGCLKPICKKVEKPEKPEVCVTLWDPVCGKDGKTYSNECFAKLANVEVNYKGACEETKECGKEGEKINRNPLLGDTSLKCCEGLNEIRVSKSYSVCSKKECETDADCPQPNCIGMKSVCVEGRCIMPNCIDIKEELEKIPFLRAE